MKKICYIKNISNTELQKIIQKGLLVDDVIAICGLHDWKDTKSIYNEKLGINKAITNNKIPITPKKIAENKRIAYLFALKTGKKTRAFYNIVQHEKYPWLLSLIKRVLVNEKAFLDYVEVEDYLKNQEILSTTLLLKLQYKMLVSGVDKCYLAIVKDNIVLDIVKINKSKEITDNLLIKCNSFWNCIKNKRLPYPDGKIETTHIINNLFPIARENDHRNLPNCYELLQVYDELVAEKINLERELRVIEQKLKLMLGQATSAYVWNRKIEWSNQQLSNFNCQEFKENFPELYEEFVELNNKRVFKIY